MTTYTYCNRMILQDDSNYRCILPQKHQGDCVGPRPNYKLEVKPAMRTITKMEEEPRMKAVSRYDGLVFSVPNWVADALLLLERIQSEQQAQNERSRPQ